ncbi:GNAT family N-acetyltransferase [Methylibium rhizosphaerae]|uniref:GNAT family N-acetyltransferase n=1 Tax=Methylibium rhizosphaerae TaxID=2570323 RepID=UPI00112AE571|nr:GNAT family N-acetyltransferase [Methylibium rhizosphaerae]
MQPLTSDVRPALAPAPRNLPTFNTERFVVAPLDPQKARELLAVLLQDEKLAEQLPWLEEKTKDGALREAFLLELQCATGATQAWGIVERSHAMFVGMVLCRHDLSGIDVEVLCASQFWNQGIADEVGEPVADWLEDNAEVELVTAH